MGACLSTINLNVSIVRAIISCKSLHMPSNSIPITELHKHHEDNYESVLNVLLSLKYI